MGLRELPVLGELAVQLEASVLMEQKVHLVQAQPVPQGWSARLVQQVQRARLELPVPRQTGRGC